MEQFEEEDLSELGIETGTASIVWTCLYTLLLISDEPADDVHAPLSLSGHQPFAEIVNVRQSSSFFQSQGNLIIYTSG